MVPIASTNGTSTVPLSTYGNFRFNGPVLRRRPPSTNEHGLDYVTGPNSVGMDEDYDACDLENWFLAIQSADGQVMIPSFHRPGIVRHDPNNPNASLQASDWNSAFRTNQGADSLARILRPVAADGHDPTTFPDLVPDPSTGKITYDVDNDGDGVTDSVWVDLGYPSRRDATGNIFKPMFAFMVIGLNGRIPLNTAGNLAGTGVTHAQHLGNSVSEIDPTYGLQNAFVYPAIRHRPVQPAPQSDERDALFKRHERPGWHNSTFNTQVDNAANVGTGVYQQIDVRSTQLRNLLSGTRPHTNPLLAANTNLNGDANAIFGSWPGSVQGAPYYLPNGIADYQDVPYTTDPTTGNPLVARTTPPVGGRWGEASSVTGVPFNNPNGGTAPPLNLVQVNYSNPVRVGYSFDIADMVTNISYGSTPFPRDAADDNFNAFDVYPNIVQNANRVGEVYDLDLYDSAGALMLPVERMRRFVTPIDINGTGRVQTWGANRDYGPDNFGRVQFNSYFRPAGVAGPINVAESNGDAYPYGAIAPLPPWRPAATGPGSATGTPRRPGPTPRPTCPT